MKAGDRHFFCFAAGPKRGAETQRLKAREGSRKQTTPLALRSNAAGIAPQPDGQANCSDPSSFRCRSCSSLSERYL
jgi:hypothetical protein